MYVIDSIPGRLYEFEFDLDSGAIGRRRLLRSFDGQAGLPDGLAVDADGCLWIACYADGCVRRVDPGGHDMLRVTLPVSRPTSCAFGAGPDLYITSAREGLSAAQLNDEPLAGAIWRIDTGVRGTPVGFAPRMTR
jgi:sugar lactone lactonase YvrE